MIKIDLHIHTSRDPKDEYISYDNTSIVSLAIKKGYKAIAITLHNSFFYKKDFFQRMYKKGLILVPGVELDIEKNHVLIYSLKRLDTERIKSFNDLERLKNQDVLIGCPHPFYPRSLARGLGRRFFEYKDIFDFLEWNGIYTYGLSLWNKKAKRIARRHRKTLIGNSDLHYLDQLGYTYSLLDVELSTSWRNSILDIFEAIRRNKSRIVSRPLPLKIFSRFIIQKIKG
ncbi:PHP domain-containing protein [Candidatus Woesearchaeota archaeon]|nr:PHP domain-containing protein [Candidatus Woesearchaeota archaeon]